MLERLLITGGGGETLGLLIYDRRPILQRVDLIFVYVINEDRLGFYARFVGSEWVRVFKKVEDDETRIREREFGTCMETDNYIQLIGGNSMISGRDRMVYGVWLSWRI